MKSSPLNFVLFLNVLQLHKFKTDAGQMGIFGGSVCIWHKDKLNGYIWSLCLKLLRWLSRGSVSLRLILTKIVLNWDITRHGNCHYANCDANPSIRTVRKWSTNGHIQFRIFHAVFRDLQKVNWWWSDVVCHSWRAALILIAQNGIRSDAQASHHMYCYLLINWRCSRPPQSQNCQTHCSTCMTCSKMIPTVF